MNSADTFLLTGDSGVGKSTIIRKVAARLSPLRIGGFVSDEIREAGARVGFRIDAIDGPSAILAHVAIRSEFRMGKYGVDIAALDRIVASALRPDLPADLFLVDEIGPMDCFSDRFVTATRTLLDSGRIVVATIHRQTHGFIGEVKSRPDVECREVTRDNRDTMPESIFAWIEAALSARRASRPARS